MARENMKAFSRVLVALVAAVAALFATTGTSHAGLDNELSLVDGKDRTLTIQQWDTFLNGVFPLDRNRLTREWFHSGSAVYSVVGPGADEFEGTLELGYQIGFPWSLGVGINFSYTTPNILFDDQNFGPAAVSAFATSIITPEHLPGCVDQCRPGQRPGHPGSRHLLGRRHGPQRQGRSLQRARHGYRCRRRCAAASVRSPDLQGW